MKRLAASKIHLGLGVAGVIALWLVPSFAFPGAAVRISILCMTFISLVAPFAADRGTHFGRSGLIATAGWLAGFPVFWISATAISGGDPGDEGMIMVVPFMLFPALMFFLSIRRAFRRSAGPPDVRGAGPAPDSSATDALRDQERAAPETEGPRAGAEAPSIGKASIEVGKSGSNIQSGLTVAAVIALWLVPSLLFRAQAFIIAFLWITAISIVAPFAADRPTHFGRAALVATVVWFAAFLGLSGAAVVISGRNPGDDAMALLLPFMLFPGLMLLVIVVRALRGLGRRLRR